MRLGVILVAAGTSSRMGFDKLMHPLSGKPVLQHSLDTFLSLDFVHAIICVTPDERFQQLKTSPIVKQVNGGKERHHSVMNGINALPNDTDYIAVHDGARPLITASQIQRVLEQAKQHSAATSARRITETVKRSNEQNFSSASVSRDHLWAMETPQIFLKDKLLEAYKKVIQSNTLVTDEVSALEHIEIPTKFVANPTPNIKITYPEDIQLSETLIRYQVDERKLSNK